MLAVAVHPSAPTADVLKGAVRRAPTGWLHVGCVTAHQEPLPQRTLRLPILLHDAAAGS